MLILTTLIIFFFNILLNLSDVMSSNQKKKNLGIYEYLGVYVICIHIINIKGLLRYIQAWNVIASLGTVNL